MKKWLIAAAAALLVSLWGIVALTAFAAVMARVTYQAQDRNARLPGAVQAGESFARLWDRHGLLLGAVIVVACFATAFVLAALFGRIARPSTAVTSPVPAPHPDPAPKTGPP